MRYALRTITVEQMLSASDTASRYSIVFLEFPTANGLLGSWEITFVFRPFKSGKTGDQLPTEYRESSERTYNEYLSELKQIVFRMDGVCDFERELKAFGPEISRLLCVLAKKADLLAPSRQEAINGFKIGGDNGNC